jgi:Secretion system C-terminal sorting domain/Putative carbohydrate metabolism domain
MKTTLLTFMMAACMGFRSQAQIPNAGFETWTSNDPSGWVTTNGLMLLGNPQSVFKSTDVHSGSFACEVNTVAITNKPPGVFVPDYTGSIFTGTQVFVTSTFGFPYTKKPGKLNFWYKFNARNGDTASILAYTTKWNTTLQKRDTLSLAISMLKDSVGVYTKCEVVFFVMDSVTTPDTAVVLFASSMITSTQAGAKLLLDDIEFTGGNVGIAEAQPLTFTVFPNPVSDGTVQLLFQESSTAVNLSILDVQGKRVHAFRGETVNGELSISTSTLIPGLYMLSVQTEKGSAVKRLVIE